jgi:hypothetical protein
VRRLVGNVLHERAQAGQIRPATPTDGAPPLPALSPAKPTPSGSGAPLAAMPWNVRLLSSWMRARVSSSGTCSRRSRRRRNPARFPLLPPHPASDPNGNDCLPWPPRAALRTAAASSGLSGFYCVTSVFFWISAAKNLIGFGIRAEHGHEQALFAQHV